MVANHGSLVCTEHGLLRPLLPAIGFQRATWGGIPLPLDLALVGLPGCWLLNSLDQALTLTAPQAGVVHWPIALPNNPQLLGAEVYLQGFCFELPGFPR